MYNNNNNFPNLAASWDKTWRLRTFNQRWRHQNTISLWRNRVEKVNHVTNHVILLWWHQKT